MKKIIRLFLCLLVVTVFLNASVAMAKEKEEEFSVSEFYKELELFADAISIIRTDYVEEVGAQELIYGALEGMLANLDPYSQFMDPDTYNDIKIETEGQFGGLGIEITIRDGLLTIISPIDGTPAQKAGVKAGDRIVKINDQLTRDMTLLEAVKVLRGQAGTTVTITVLRESENELLDIEIERAIIKLESIKYVEMVDDTVGYIRLSEFQEKSPADLKKALNELNDKGMKSLILDLRNNPGGLLDVAIDIADEFLPAGELIVSTRGRDQSQEVKFKSRRALKNGKFPMVVLINDGSASASEIVAGALKDHHRAILMGTKSFGKGSVQTVIPLGDGSALRLTTSKYFTPSGVCIHETGIMPDIVVPFQPVIEQEEEAIDVDAVFDKVKEGKVPDKKKDDANVEDKKLQMDNQLLRAIDLLKALTVYNYEDPEAVSKKQE